MSMYGINPWIRFKLANVSEELSDAMNWWKTVEARLTRQNIHA